MCMTLHLDVMNGTCQVSDHCFSILSHSGEDSSVVSVDDFFHQLGVICELEDRIYYTTFEIVNKYQEQNWS